MKIIITGKKIDITAGMKENIERKLSKLAKYFHDEPQVKVTLGIEKGRHNMEVTIYSKNMMYRAERSGNDMYAIMDEIIDIIERQMRRHKTKLEKKLKREAFDLPLISNSNELEEEEVEFNIVKTKTFTFTPMSVEEAILQMNLLGHQFFVFSNIDTEKMNIVYKRKDGNYALIIQD